MLKFISGKNINLRDIEPEDAEFVLSLRLNESKNKFLNSTNAGIEEQRKYINNYKLKENEWYFIIESKSHEKLGTIRIYDVVDDNFCWGSWLVKDGVPKTTALESALLLYDYAFGVLKFKKVHFDVRNGNLRVKAFHERFGAVPVGQDELDTFYTYDKDKYLSIRERYINKFALNTVID